MTHFLQSSAWQKFQESIGRTTFSRHGDGWEFMTILESGKFNTRLYCPYGPIARDEQAFLQSLEALKNLGKEQNVTFIRVEPENPDFIKTLSTHHWKPVTYQKLQPSHTSIIDLNQSTDDIVAHMSQPDRNTYRNYVKKGLSIQQSSDPADIKILLKFIHQVSERTGFRPHDDDYFQKQANALFPIDAASLWYAKFDDEPIAAALFYDSDDTRIYAHAGASSLREHRKLNSGTALLAEAIVDAKQKGLSKFDLYGIAPDGAPISHPWFGFTKFKRSFGGSDVAFAGAWDLPLRKPTYWLYRAYQSIRK